jgi:hypothetical protein
MELVHRDEDLLNHITTGLHPKIVEKMPGATSGRVEKNLRDARDIILERSDPEQLKLVMSGAIHRYPSVGDLLDILDYYMRKNDLWPDEGQGGS